MIRRLYVEKRPQYALRAAGLKAVLQTELELVEVASVRVLLRYDVEGIDAALWQRAKESLFVEPATETCTEAQPWGASDHVIAVEYLPGQFDQRADSAVQCLHLLGEGQPVVRCAEVFVFTGDLDAAMLERIEGYLINPVDSRVASLALPETLQPDLPQPAPVAVLEDFIRADEAALAALHARLGLAMTLADLAFCQSYFRDQERRDPTLTEIKLLDTYWSDHCRHTTFLTEIEAVEFAEDPCVAPVQVAWQNYLGERDKVYGAAASGRPVCLMDIALMGMKRLRACGKLTALEVSEEVNAASIVVPVEIDGKSEEWLVMFKNETHNHPTEIEPFGGAATCLGGAIRDPLSGRSYVYQAMRVTGAADPRKPIRDTLPGKLPQRKITVEAAHGYSSYGNQIGLATGMVTEVYHPGYEAKRMEIGAVIAAAPRAQVVRGTPVPGDVIVLVGGRTGRDGIGGATGSSKEHDDSALENAAEVQKGDPPMERRLQRLFRDADVSRLIKRCNDFGAGGVAVAIGELADGLDIDLNAVPLKYAGLDGTEIALSESQERMAVVLDPSDVAAFVAASAAENLTAVAVAKVTDTGRLCMDWNGNRIVNIAREFLDTNGVRQRAKARVGAPVGGNPLELSAPVATEDLAQHWCDVMADLNVCDQRGMAERFDSTIGAASVLHPFGGKTASTPAEAMVAKLPLLHGNCDTATAMSFGFHPGIAAWSPFHGGVFAVVEAVARVVAAGAAPDTIHLTLQEYFERLRDDPTRWGKPLAALLGAFEAQRQLDIAAIGGKDSMSGTFKDMDVPPSLVAFAVATVDVHHVRSPEFKRSGSTIVSIPLPCDANWLPDWDAFKQVLSAVHDGIISGRILSVGVCRHGGLAACLAKMAFGNQIGCGLADDLDDVDLFACRPGSFVLELPNDAALDDLPNARWIGQTIAEPVVRFAGGELPLQRLYDAWSQPLSGIFPQAVAQSVDAPPAFSRLYQPHVGKRAKVSVAMPRVLIPVFPGTNCEYDSERAFIEAGARVQTLVVRNQSRDDINASVEAMAEALGQCQILMLAGGFSAGDEPGGSGKFIAALLRNQRLSDAIERLLQQQDGLVLGICNGFQALVKLGLLPCGKIRPMTADSPSLTDNTIGRHVSAYVSTKVVSRLSPWLAECPLGAIYKTPVSHGEGRFVAPEPVIEQLFCNDQIATQYVDANGLPTLQMPDNPNGSLHAIEGITSACGRIFGRMGHSERTGSQVGINIPGEKSQPVFRAGVGYFA